ncbi:MAG: M24 family metallopeptidase [Nitrososphaerota archaeon]|nr:M24 family metallopeptidase [Nitrososphaerota archaeon]MDG6959480.1 M24 family metallopeptidase [Nitrososphaerota archaeon]MDG6968054.1 M24 family metallopeptidase [Nitrososphaerota archaeon]MDG6969339.1 M24 family metallopeptidase [Nitrososphaerota archaeon]MDG7015288.1 M24 family metallopeptidase [Nitrososphaerota archaeon]
MTVFSQRRKKLLSLAKGKQVAAYTAPNLFYLTDFFGGGAAVVRPDKTVVVTSPLEADRAGEVAKEAEVVVVRKWKDVGKEIEKQLGGGRAVVDREGLKSKKLEPNPGLFLEARRFKDKLELERIRKACAKTDKTYEALERALKPGRTEWELAAEVMKAALEEGLTPSNSDSSLGPIIIASGPHGAYGHSELSGRRVKSGDFVVADLFFRYEGYNSDETRTFAVGTVTSEMKKRYAAVKDAQQAAIDAVTDGVSCGSVHDAALGVLRKHGVDRYLNHSVGHGVGIDIHELPGIFHGSAVKLGRNDVITDEPGVYFVGKYGIRIEDTLRVDRKPEIYTRFTKDLVTCG